MLNMGEGILIFHRLSIPCRLAWGTLRMIYGRVIHERRWPRQASFPDMNKDMTYPIGGMLQPRVPSSSIGIPYLQQGEMEALIRLSCGPVGDSWRWQKGTVLGLGLPGCKEG